MIALLDPPSSTAIDTRPAAVREWSTCADYYEGPIGDPPRGPVGFNMALRDERICSLIAEDYSEPEPLMGSMLRDLRRGDRQLATRLMRVVRDASIGTTARALALEILASSKVRTIEPELREIIIEAIERRNADMQFTAVAVASDLSRQSQIILAGAIRRLVQPGVANHWVQRAANAFLDSL